MTRRKYKRWIGFAIGLPAAVFLPMLRPSLVRAQAAHSLSADQLFFQAKRLMAEGHIATACEKFEQSVAIQRRGGALLNLAVCRSAEGRNATALGLFEEALALAEKDGRDDRRELARAQIEITRRKLCWLTISPAPQARVPGLVVQRDGELLPADRWDQSVAVDPGGHTVTASAPGAASVEISVVVGGPGEIQHVVIPPLAPQPAPLFAPPSAVVPAGTSVARPAPPLSRPAPVAQRTPKPLAWATAGVGVASLAVGGVLGIKVLYDNAAVRRLCPRQRCATDEGVQKNHEAYAEALVVDIAVPIGLIFTGIGVYSLLASSSAAPPARAVAARGITVVPAAGRNAVGVSVERAW